MQIYLNGNIIDSTEAKVSVFDRGYLFGEGLFETFRSYDGGIPFLEKHINRMEWSATFIGLPFPHPGEIKEAVSDTLKANDLKNARIKMVLTGMNEGSSPRLLTDQADINFVVIAEKFSPYSDQEYDEGVSLALIHSIKNDPVPTSTMKTVNYMTKLIAQKEYSEKSCFDGILFNALGYVTETAAANIYWVRDNIVHTPPTNEGLLLGVTREIVTDILKEEMIEFKETLIQEKDLKKLNEIFITNSLIEIMPVTSIGEDSVGNGEPGKLTQKLTQLYQERLNEEIKRLKT